MVAGSAIGKVQPSRIEKTNGNEKIRWLENLLFFCCIHRILMKNADSQTKMLKIRHLTYEIISQIKKFRRVSYSMNFAVEKALSSGFLKILTIQLTAKNSVSLFMLRCLISIDGWTYLFMVILTLA